MNSRLSETVAVIVSILLAAGGRDRQLPPPIPGIYKGQRQG